MLKNNIQIVWFKRDLRITDHGPLFEASLNSIPTLPIYIVETDYWKQPFSSKRHWSFIHDSLKELRKDLKNIGQNLVVRIGSAKDIVLMGGNSVQDVSGPIISFEDENGKQLRNGDHLDRGKQLYLRLSDPIGINLTGEVGHEIIFSDVSNGNDIDITHLFIYDENSITTGKIPINYLDNDNLNFQIQAWDNANNPSQKDIKLFIINNNDIILFNVFNYPNPFKNNTQFSFEINQSAEVEINIYTLGGRKIKNIRSDYYEAGYHYINWDGKDTYGDNIANGVYLYSLKAINNGKSISKIGKVAKYQ